MSDGGSGSGDRIDGIRSLLARAGGRLRGVGVVRAVVAVTILALLARLVFLGARTAHYDEARVAWWILHTIESGDFVYRRIIHGPFIQHVSHVLYPLLGTTDFVMRLPVAIIGGLLPLTALLFRDYLEDDEVFILSLFLAFNAVLLYYSRFMRSDLLVATFMFAALGCLLKLYHTQRTRYLYGAVFLAVLGFAAKENALVYVLTWIGATGLVLVHEFYRWADVRGALGRLWESPIGSIRHGIRHIPWAIKFTLGRLWRLTRRGLATHERGAFGWVAHALGAAVVFVAITVLMYGLRGEVTGIWHLEAPAPYSHLTVNLAEATSNPTALPRYVYETVGYTGQQYVEWFSPASDPKAGEESILDGWLIYLWNFIEVMLYKVRVLSAFAIIGFLVEFFGRGRARNIVLFLSYAGFASVLGYPLGTDIFGAWLVVHAMVPLAVPAAVGVALVYRWGRDAWEWRDHVGVTLAAVVLCLLVAQVAAINVGSVYSNETDRENELVQFAQPADDLDPLIEAVERTAAENRSGADVVYYYGLMGEDYDDREALVDRSPQRVNQSMLVEPACTRWWGTLPLPWYLTRAGANASCNEVPAELVERAQTQAPGVIITASADPTVPDDALQAAGYESRRLGIRTYSRTLVVFVHERVGGI